MNKRVLVVGGSKEFPGAVYLAAVSALRVGASSVVVMAPESAAVAINVLSPDIVTYKLPGEHLSLKHLPAIEEKLQHADVLLLGCGATRSNESIRLMKQVMRWEGQKVIDADALYALQQEAVSHALLTPNPSEWELLAQYNDIPTLLEKDVVILQKGTEAVVHDVSGKEWLTVHPGLEKAGSGDVLAGLCAGLLAVGRSKLETAQQAVEIGNQIAVLLTEARAGYVPLASELAEAIEQVHVT